MRNYVPAGRSPIKTSGERLMRIEASCVGKLRIPAHEARKSLKRAGGCRYLSVSRRATMGIGETAALTAALLWAVASLLYGRVRLSAWEMNCSKNVIASAFLLIQLGVIFLLGHSESWVPAHTSAWLWLGFSGVIGITLGDTCYFRSLQILGPRESLVVFTTAPLFGAALGWIFLQEHLTLVNIAGMLITVSAVAWVVSEKGAASEAPGLYPGSRKAGIFFGVMGAVCQAVGQIFAKKGLAYCTPVESAFIRLVVAAVGAVIVLLCLKRTRSLMTEMRRPGLLKAFLPAVTMGTWLGIWLSQVCQAHCSVAVCITLLNVSPLFAIPLVWYFQKQQITRRAITGSVVAVLGVALLVARPQDSPQSADSPDRAATESQKAQ